MSYHCNKCGYMGETGPTHIRSGSAKQCDYYAAEVAYKDPSDPFQALPEQDITERLRGQYRIGPHLPNGKPEFGFRQFESTPLQHAAAAEIERLRAEIIRLNGVIRKATDTLLVAAAPGWVEAKQPCGECHLKPGEICDVCRAQQAG